MLLISQTKRLSWFNCASTQHSQDDGPVSAQCWASIADGGPTLSQYRPIVLCFLGINDFIWFKTFFKSSICGPGLPRVYLGYIHLIINHCVYWSRINLSKYRPYTLLYWKCRLMSERIHVAHSTIRQYCAEGNMKSGLYPMLLSNDFQYLSTDDTMLINTTCRPNVVLMLGHRLRRWPNIKPTSDERLVFTWMLAYLHSLNKKRWLQTATI